MWKREEHWNKSVKFDFQSSKIYFYKIEVLVEFPTVNEDSNAELIIEQISNTKS